MKLSSQAILFGAVLAAIANLESAEAGSVRNGRPERKRNLIKVKADPSPTGRSVVETEADEMIEIENADLSRVLMSMSMSMSMPSGGADDSEEGGSSSDGGSDGGSDGSDGSDGSGSGSGSDGSDSGGEGSDEADRSDVSDPSTGGSDSAEVPVDAPSPSDGSGGFDAPSGQLPASDDEEEESSSTSRSVAIAAVATTAMVVPLLL